ncbi:MAG: DUF2975 domain-containing protein [Nonlabens sp.]|nr:DUF2975 domain-containing protein [Nonlabens sp.]
MKWLSIFRAVLNLVYLLTLISALGIPIAIYLLVSQKDFNYSISGITLINYHWSFYLVLFFSVLGYLAFIRMLYLMRSASIKLSPRKLFNHETATIIIKAGRNCILAGMLTKIPILIYRIVFRSRVVTTNSDTDSIEFLINFDTLFVIISFGFFLMLTGIVMKEGNTLKQENDLTI